MKVDDYLLNEASFKEGDEKVLYWIKYMEITSETIHMCQITSEAALIALPISTTASNTNEIMLEGKILGTVGSTLKSPAL